MDLSILDVAFAATVVLAASIIRGYSGFGFSAVLVAGLAFIIDPIEAVPLAIGLEVLASIVQGKSVWTDIEWRRCGVLLVAAVIGNPIGVWILTTVDADPLRAATFILLTLLTLGLLLGKTVDVTATLGVFFLVGIVAGVVNGATAMSGLVLVLFMTVLKVAPAEMRGTLVAYFFASDIAVLGLLVWRDELDTIYAWRILLSVPIMIIGVVIGDKAFDGASVESFRRTTLYILLAISIVGLGRFAIA